MNLVSLGTDSKENKRFSLSSSTWLQLVLACYGSKMVAENGWDIPGFFLLLRDTRECILDLVILSGLEGALSAHY